MLFVIKYFDVYNVLIQSRMTICSIFLSLKLMNFKNFLEIFGMLKKIDILS